VRISGGIQKFLVFHCLFFGLITSCAESQNYQVGQKHSPIKSKPTEVSSELIISAAASMQQVLEEIRTVYNQQHPQAKIVFNFGSSGSLQHQIEQGAPVDIFISAASRQMNNLADKQLIIADSRQDLVKNQMVLVVPKNSRAIDSFADLAHRSVEQIALGEPRSVPAGQYAQEILSSLNIVDVVNSKAIYGKDARQVFNYVATGNTDAGIVYRTDALNAERVKTIDIAPEAAYSDIVYPVAIVKESKNTRAAKQLLQFLFSAEAQAIFQRNGFLSLNSDRRSFAK